MIAAENAARGIVAYRIRRQIAVLRAGNRATAPAHALAGNGHGAALGGILKNGYAVRPGCLAALSGDKRVAAPLAQRVRQVLGGAAPSLEGRSLTARTTPIREISS